MGELDAEHLILGAGLAGLSLAVRLARRPRSERGRVLIVDPRTEFGADRTWCGWRGAAHPFEGAITHRWSRWRAITDAQTIERSTPSRPYEHVAGERLYEEALRALEGVDGLELRLGNEARTWRDEGETVRVETSCGALRSRLVWDARGGSPSVLPTAADTFWVQHFVGWVVRTEKPIFDPDVATLMDFRVPQHLGPHFVYVLPFSACEALVEDTYFGEASLATDAYEATLRAWLDQHRAGAYEIVRRERGVLPMTTAPLAPRASRRVIPLGLLGGAAKPSTGYAFRFVQRHSDRLAEVARDGRTPPPEIAMRSHAATFFDRVFLSYLRRNPESAPQVFGGLFDRASPDAIARFLSEDASPLQHLEVMRAVPMLGVGLEAVRSAPVWMRER